VKIPEPIYNKMLAALRAVVEDKGGPTGAGRGLSNLWQLWWIANDNLLYDDNHPYFKSGHWKRIVPHDPQFSLRDYNDSHIETAIKRAGKELGVL
jgi:hypothetical protein